VQDGGFGNVCERPSGCHCGKQRTCLQTWDGQGMIAFSDTFVFLWFLVITFAS
jgi:hypothetical protein